MKSSRLKSWTAIVAILIAITPAYAVPSFLGNMLSAIDSPPEITTAYLDKAKYQPGDQMLITAAVSDDWGLKKVKAQIENENGWDTVTLILLTGNARKGTWQGAWKVQDTVGIKEYKTKIIATDLSVQTAEKTLLWIDPVQSHPPEQIRAGTFQTGSYKFPDNVGIGADATSSDKLKIVKTSTGGNAINANCAAGTGSCDAVYAVSDGGAGVKGTSTSNYGVYGKTTSGDSGVVGFNDGSGNGVGGASTSGYGIYGRTTSGNAGVMGDGQSTAIGVRGISGSNYGVYGKTTSGDSGVVGFNDGSGNGVGGASTSGYGVYGRTSSSGSAGVMGDGGSGKGVYGQSTGNTGVYGASTTGNGVLGTSDSATGVWGGSQTGNGVYGSTNGNGASGVFGNNGGAGNGVAGISNTGTGIYGKSTSGYSGYFEGGTGVKIAGNQEITGRIKITGGSPGAGKILASDANGLANWQTPTGGVGLFKESTGYESGITIGTYCQNKGYSNVLVLETYVDYCVEPYWCCGQGQGSIGSDTYVFPSSTTVVTAGVVGGDCMTSSKSYFCGGSCGHYNNKHTGFKVACSN